MKSVKSMWRIGLRHVAEKKGLVQISILVLKPIEAEFLMFDQCQDFGENEVLVKTWLDMVTF